MDWDVRRFDQLDSTNRAVVDLARGGAPPGLVVTADHQTAGRGRLGRPWMAPPGSSLLASVLLRPDLPAARLHLAVAAVALAAAEALEAVAGFRPGLKWPNDLVVPRAGAGEDGAWGLERKLGGVLAEALPSTAQGGGRTGLVVGIGLNLNWPGPLPPAIAASAVSADRVAGRVVDREAVLFALLAGVERRAADWPAVGSEYRAACVTVGRAVRVELADETFTGTAADVTDEGNLLVDVGMCLRSVSAGDVVHLR